MGADYAESLLAEWLGDSEGLPNGGHLLAHVLQFGRLLRIMGVNVSLSQMLDLVKALGYVSITDRDSFYYSARALLVNRREDLPIFDQAFRLFWEMQQPPEKRDPTRPTKTKRARLPERRAEDVAASAARYEQAQLEPQPGDGEELVPAQKFTQTYSPAEVLRHKDFNEMTWEEIQEAKRAIASLAWKLGQRRTRRYRAGPKGRLNLRSVVRDNLSHGGEPLRLSHRLRMQRPRPLVILCDISGSMERYSRMLLHFVHALTHGMKDVPIEAFVFGTRLTRITHHLRHRDVDESMDEVSKAVFDWSGGTRIGESLKTFNFRWARRVLGSGAVALVISDGWDRGDVDLLRREVARLQRSCYRLIWLNPLLGTPGYRPDQRGMVAALPFIDDFLPGHNLASLEQMADILSSVGMTRPERRQHPVLPGQTEYPVPASYEVGQPSPREQSVRHLIREYPFLRDWFPDHNSD
mgnify:CR=1 FL=1